MAMSFSFLLLIDLHLSSCLTCYVTYMHRQMQAGRYMGSQWFVRGQKKARYLVALAAEGQQRGAQRLHALSPASSVPTYAGYLHSTVVPA
jgi:hypothetical protein